MSDMSAVEWYQHLTQADDALIDPKIAVFQDHTVYFKNKLSCPFKSKYRMLKQLRVIDGDLSIYTKRLVFCQHLQSVTQIYVDPILHIVYAYAQDPLFLFTVKGGGAPNRKPYKYSFEIFDLIHVFPRVLYVPFAKHSFTINNANCMVELTFRDFNPLQTPHDGTGLYLRVNDMHCTWKRKKLQSPFEPEKFFQTLFTRDGFVAKVDWKSENMLFQATFLPREHYVLVTLETPFRCDRRYVSFRELIAFIECDIDNCGPLIHFIDNVFAPDVKPAQEFIRQIRNLVWNSDFVSKDRCSVCFISVLPTNLTALFFSNDFNYSITSGMLPESLRRLEFGNQFNQPLISYLGDSILPNGLEVLHFGDAFNQNFPGDESPNSLTDLKFGHSFNTDLFWMSQNHLTSLVFGNRFNSHLTKTCMTTSLRTLQFGSDFNGELLTLSPHLINLVLGASFTQELPPLPKSLRFLQISKRYSAQNLINNTKNISETCFIKFI